MLEQTPGGFLDVYREEFSLTESSVGTEVKANFDYKVSLAYVGTSLNIAMLENGIAASPSDYLKNLKELAELRPLKGPTTRRPRR